jgi:FkbM family methyltransferase
MWQSRTVERTVVLLGASAWDQPLAGRFVRSVTGRHAERLRESPARFRRVIVTDIPLVLDVTEFTTASLYFGRKVYEPLTTAYIRDHLSSGGIFVDVGAHHGYFTTLAAAVVGPEGRVFAFEPNPPVYRQLQEHVRLNGFSDRVVALQQALSDAARENVPLFVSQCPGNSGLSSLIASPEGIGAGGLRLDRTIPVQTDSFDLWMAKSRVARVDLVKIDTEASEEQVVHGMMGALKAGQIGGVVCETRWGSEAHRILCASGFIPRVLERNEPLMNIAYAPQH